MLGRSKARIAIEDAQFETLLPLFASFNPLELTRQEIRVLLCRHRGVTVKGTADLMGIELSTVKFHSENILRKTHSTSMAQSIYMFFAPPSSAAK